MCILAISITTTVQQHTHGLGPNLDRVAKCDRDRAVSRSHQADLVRSMLEGGRPRGYLQAPLGRETLREGSLNEG